MKTVDTDKIKTSKTISEQIEEIKEEFCDNYCKIPYKYSVNDWEEIVNSENSPCLNCPLNKL